MKLLLASTIALAALCCAPEPPPFATPAQKCETYCEAACDTLTNNCDDGNTQDAYDCAIDCEEAIPCREVSFVSNSYDECLRVVNEGDVGCDETLPPSCHDIFK